MEDVFDLARRCYQEGARISVNVRGPWTDLHVRFRADQGFNFVYRSHDRFDNCLLPSGLLTEDFGEAFAALPLERP